MSGLQHRIEALLGLLPPVLHRMALRRAHGLRKLWWTWRKPQVAGVRILALDSEGRVLLVRHSYGPTCWMPPGGGLHGDEDPIPAAARELSEELGCTLDAPRVAAVMLDSLHGAGNRVHVVVGWCQGDPAPDLREITHAGFFAPDALPEDLGKGLARNLPLWIKEA